MIKEEVEREGGTFQSQILVRDTILAHFLP